MLDVEFERMFQEALRCNDVSTARTLVKHLHVRLETSEGLHLATMRALRGEPVIVGPLDIDRDVAEAWKIRKERDALRKRCGDALEILGDTQCGNEQNDGVDKAILILTGVDPL